MCQENMEKQQTNDQWEFKKIKIFIRENLKKVSFENVSQDS